MGQMEQAMEIQEGVAVAVQEEERLSELRKEILELIGFMQEADLALPAERYLLLGEMGEMGAKEELELRLVVYPDHLAQLTQIIYQLWEVRTGADQAQY
jgi:hypothetical protein